MQVHSCQSQHSAEQHSPRYPHGLRRPATRLAAAVVLIACGFTAEAAELTIPQLLAQRDQWPQWNDARHKVQLTGRFKGRAATRIQLQKTDITFVPERGIRLPDRLPLGTRLNISGYFVQTGEKPEFRATYLTTAPSDYEVLHQRLANLDETDAKGRYGLADEYETLAEFYDDRQLQAAIDRCRSETFEMQRRNHRKDPVALWKLIDPGPDFEIPEAIRQHIRFEVFRLRMRQPSDPQLLNDLRQHFPGWDTPAPDIPTELQEAFLKDRVATYGAAGPVARRQLERLTYRQLRLKELQATVLPDASNALTVADTTTQELPEETDAIRGMRSDWADHRLRSTRDLKRRELDQLVEMLRRIDRSVEADRALDQWLSRQVELFRDRGYQWQLRLADEFLHAWTRWKQPDHRDLGVDYLKRAWTAASKEAPDAVADIEARLSNLGWSRLNNRWMTEADVKLLPADSTARAEKDGYVAPGMTMDQVRRIQGVASRRIRMASSRGVEEVWIYGERGSSRLMIHLRHRTGGNGNDAVVTKVRQISSVR